jgi:predicted nucleic acid-binding protein
VVSEFVEQLIELADVVTIGPVRSRQIANVAVRTRLRAADAAYVWLAEREGLVLVTADQEVIDRGAALCTITAP